MSLCSFTFSDGRRCRTPRISSHPHFCFYHAQKEARTCAADKLGKDLAYFFSGDYLSACDLSTALGRLIPAVVRGEVKPRAARTVAYLAQTLMQAIHVSQHEYCEAFDTDDWREAIRNSVKGNYDYRFPPGAQPASQPAETPINCHSERTEESASSSNSPLATRHSSLPQQPATSPHIPLPPTSAEFAQHVLAGLPRFLRSDPVGQTGERQAPQPAQATPPAPQPADTPINCHSDAEPPINCHSERSEESAFSSSPAPPQIQAQQSVSAPPANPPQAAPVAPSSTSSGAPLPSAPPAAPPTQPNNPPPTTPPTPPPGPNRDAPWLHFGDPGKIPPDSHLL